MLCSNGWLKFNLRKDQNLVNFLILSIETILVKSQPQFKTLLLTSLRKITVLNFKKILRKTRQFLNLIFNRYLTLIADL